jgi:putative oxidoreductase
LLYVVKVLELLCGLALLTGFFVPLALLVLAPIIANIVFFHIALDPSGLMMGVLLTTLWVTNAMSHRIIFAPLIQTKPKVK